MFAISYFKVSCFLSILIALAPRATADEGESQDDSKFKYGYVISHKEGSTQAHVESRDGEMALGRYYVNHPNGSGQKVTYFADDLGFHSGVSYTNRLGRGSSKTEIAMGPKAIAALADFEAEPSSILAASTAVPLHGVKISQKLLQYETEKLAPESLGKLSYAPGTVKGFYLTKEPLTVTSTPPKLISEHAGQTSVNLNAGTHSATPPIQAFLQSSPKSNAGPAVETVPSFTHQKSIERTHFNNDETHLILAVQKHAESIIRKDLAKELPSKLQNDNKGYLPTQRTASTVTMKPIIITDSGINNVQNILSSTFAPEVKKLVKDFQSDSFNSLKVTEKSGKDQALEDSGYFKVSLSPSFISALNASQATEPSIDIKAESRNLNNSMLCKSNLCEFNKNPIFINGEASKKPKKDTAMSSDVTNTDASQKVTQTFYPESQVMAEKHYITTIDVQKGISLDVRQMEDGSIRLANSFESNKLSSLKQPYNLPTIRPILSNSIFVTPSSHSGVDNVYFTTPNEGSATISAVTQSPAMFAATPQQNIHAPTSLSPPVASFSQLPPNNLRHQTQFNVQIVNSDSQYSLAQSNLINDNKEMKGGAEELRELQQNIQELKQKIINDVDIKHEEENRKQKFNENERREYMENLKKVEEVKEQKPLITYSSIAQPAQANIPVSINAAIQEQNVPPVIPVVENTVQPQNNAYANTPEIANIPTASYSNQQIQSPIAYQQPIVAYATQGYQTVESQNERKYLETPAIQNSYVSQPVQASQNIQLTDFMQNPSLTSNIVTQSEIKPQYVQNVNFYKDSTNTLSFNSEPQLLAQETNLQYLAGSSPLVNTIAPYDINSYYTMREPVSYINNYQMQVAAETQQIAAPTVYQFPQQVLSGVQVTQPKLNVGPLLTYPITLSHPESVNKLRIQPLKPSPPNEGAQSQATLPQAVQPQPVQSPAQAAQAQVAQAQAIQSTTAQAQALQTQATQAQLLQAQMPQAQILQAQIPQAQILQAQIPQAQILQAQIPQAQFAQSQIPQNLLPPSQFQQTYFFPSFPSGNRLHLRHIKKNRNLNSDQVPSQSQTSVLRKGKSISSPRLEYGFKPPLRPSVEYTEEVKPSIYGPSTRQE